MSYFDTAKSSYNISQAAPLCYTRDFFSTTESPWTSAAIASGTSASATNAPTVNHPGQIAYLSSTSNASGFYVNMSANALILAGNEECNFVFYMPSSIYATATTHLGFHTSITAVTPVDGIYFTIAGATVTASTANNSTRTTSSTLATLSAATWYRMRVFTNSDASAAIFELYSEAGAILASTTITTNIPTARVTKQGFVCYSGASDTTAATIITMDYIDIKINRLFTR